MLLSINVITWQHVYHGPLEFWKQHEKWPKYFVQYDTGFVILTLRTSILTLMRISIELYLSKMFIIFWIGTPNSILFISEVWISGPWYSNLVQFMTSFLSVSHMLFSYYLAVQFCEILYVYIFLAVEYWLQNLFPGKLKISEGFVGPLNVLCAHCLINVTLY